MDRLAPPPRLLPLLLVIAILPGARRPASGCFTAIFSFGDSIADTGNAIRLGSLGASSGSPPYGRTFFDRPTGRFSDGRVIIDFIGLYISDDSTGSAQGLGLPLVRPYLDGGSGDDFRQGANFAVGGATALDLDFFSTKGIQASWTDRSLRVQIESFKQLLSSLSSGRHSVSNNDD
ncbi:hypothetical protein BHE74_00059594 [Ensete ventricosum]|uniref:Uncharacterized protein n=1 Tax=Ensete ventricosum TaxID=4639 RepID=A0A444CU83_ENSVE|nr:hypothetical protein B296_00058004 [Ensete ventricosum]RWV89431.1 hypothetical protein GW17_00048420 [Ensete ventricosum]RWW35471.1 hypothetical protein BHE74_00059594 [Ensete ventricosum]RZS29376.1 hypothetical protein BHM03_00063100 [Ensete ventricosum]